MKRNCRGHQHWSGSLQRQVCILFQLQVRYVARDAGNQRISDELMIGREIVLGPFYTICSRKMRMQSMGKDAENRRLTSRPHRSRVFCDEESKHTHRYGRQPD